MQTSVLQYLEITADKFPGKVAFFDDKKKITFGELRSASINLADVIEREIGCVHNPVLIFLPKAVESIVAFMAVLYSGNFYTPTDIRFPKEKLESVVSALHPAAVIGNTKTIKKLEGINGLESAAIINIDEEGSHKSERTSAQLIGRILDTDPVYVFFTSGSTGAPKGVIINNHNVIDYIDWASDAFHINEHTIMGNQSPFYFDISTQDIYSTLKTGATLGIIPVQYFAFPVKVLEFINENNINFLYWVPSAYIGIANLNLLDNHPLPNVELMMFGGEVMPVKQLNYWREHLQGLKTVANVYGPTEATVNCTYYIMDREFAETETLPLGYACKNTGLLVLDEKWQEITADDVGKQGELCVYGSSLSLGYWNDQEKTAEKYIRNPLCKNYYERMYLTGDLVYYNDRGELIFVGRKDFQIKHFGYRIELGEIEAATMGNSKIKNCCAAYDQKRKQIVLFYEGELTDEELEDSLLEIIPKYMVPTVYHRLSRFSYNDNGKIDRLALRKEFLDGDD